MNIVLISLLSLSNLYSVYSSIGNNGNGKLPRETQRAQCTITAGEVQASAEAIVSKTLEGVCGADEMKLAFTNLELKLLQELDTIKEIIRSIHNPTPGEKLSKLSSENELQLKATHRNDELKHRYTNTIKKQSSTKDEIFDERSKKHPSSKTLVTIPHLNTEKLSRDAEVHKLNNTMLSGSETKLFAYYWKLDKFTEKLKSNVTIDYSPLFTILGKQLRLKAFFNHLNRGFLYLQLEESVNIKHDGIKSVFLETGNMFKPLQMKLHFKHKIAVLHQDATTKLDLESQEFSSIENGFLIPNSALLTNAFLKNDTILVKLILYL